jgi:HEPN domain-containing protein
MRQRAHPLPSLVCFHAQQCIEKYLKAALLFHGRAFPKTHDLIELHELCLVVIPKLSAIFEAISILSPYGVGVRYPGTANTLGQAKEATEAMKHAREFLRKRLE